MRIASRTDMPTMKDKPVMSLWYDLGRNVPRKFFLNGKRSRAAGRDETDSMTYPEYVSIDCHSGFSKHYCLNHICSFPTNTRKLQKRFEITRHLSTEFVP